MRFDFKTIRFNIRRRNCTDMTGAKSYGLLQEQLDEDKKTSRSFRKFSNAVKTKSTSYQYCKSLDAFMRFSKFNKYDSLKELKSDDLQDAIEEWIMSQGHNAHGSVAAKFAAVKLFLNMNRIVFFATPALKLFPADKHLKSGKLPYTTEEIDRMLEVAHSWKLKALVLFFSSTGGRPGALVDEDGYLQLKHIKEMSDGCLNIKIYAGTNEEYDSFLTPESALALKRYFSFRESKGEVLTPESPIFKSERGRNCLSSHSASERIRDLLIKADVKRTRIRGHRFDKAVVYGFRKRFNTIMKINNEVNSNIAEKLMAHKRGLDGTYLQPTTEECFREFKKGIPYLTINEEEKLKVKVLKLQSKLTQQTKDQVLSIFEMMDVNLEDLKEFAAQKRRDRKYK